MDGSSKPTQQLSREETIKLRQQFVGPSCTLFYRPHPLKIVRAEGQYMYDEEDHPYLDCINNVCHVGHCHPTVVEAAVDQMRTLNTNSRFLHDNLVCLAQKLVSTMPPNLSVVYFTNSGSEANDLALRLARHHTKASEIIALERAYHGHVVAALEVSPYKLDCMVNGVEKKPDYVHMAEVPDIYRGKYRDNKYSEKELGDLYVKEVDDIISSIHKDGKSVCCIIAESIQSCGGQIFYPKGYLDRIFRNVQAAGGVAIADEVQVGFGRVGTHMWSFDAQGSVPDIVTMGKPMGNGHPISGVVTTPEIAASFDACGVEFFSTFAGNPVSCAISLAVMETIEKDKLKENACRVGDEMKLQLTALKEKHKTIGDIRGVGMFWGIDLVKDRTTREADPETASTLVRRLKEEDRILISRDGPHENVLKFKPPMCFSLDNVETLVSALDRLLSELENSEKSEKIEGEDKGKPVIDADSEEPPAKRSCLSERANMTSRVKVG